MKKIAAFIIALIFTGQALAANDGLKIAVVNSHTLIEKSKAFEHIQKKIEQKGKAFQAATKRHEEELSQKVQELDKQRSLYSNEAYEQKRQNLAQDAQKAHMRFRQDKESIDHAFSDSVGMLQEKARKVLKAEVDKEKYDLVINTTSLLYSNDKYDITDKLLKALNEDKKLPNEVGKKITNIKLSFEK
jgi:outer membrane protein